MEIDHISYMQQALSLAKKGLGNVSPNPMVGCVIVHDHKIVAEGYHQKYGEAHAEVNAINALPQHINPSECTLYVTLEPCSHFGKTPPCSDLIIKTGFKKVVIANLDTNPLVGGKGIEKLRNAGIEVITGVCEKEGRELNKRFFTLHEKKRPYILLKWAQTADGFISRSNPVNPHDNWITGPEAKQLVHQMRSEEDAILVGRNTVITDDPQLTTRLVKGRNPLRVIISKIAKFDPLLNIFSKDARTIVFNSELNEVKENVTFEKVDFIKPITPQILEKLAKMGISSIIVEGGAETLNSFINAELWDEMRVFVNPKLNFKTGVLAPKTMLNTDFQYIGHDKLYILYPKH
ncbi:MAG: bifunctional diaminohydroxyphosphoribosylaminopyrimidine deaminase/5-amino-6-(5-phosphoribosylamino)uracil reductase RibD [Sphingobacteriaceae bacterium]